MRKKIALIGSGNVATFLGTALRKANNTITQVYSPTFAHAEKLGSRLGAESIDNLSHLKGDADLYIIAVSDDAIASVASLMPEFDKIVVHTAGAVSIDTLKPASPHHGVLYPYQSLRVGEMIDIANMCIFFDATDEDTMLLLEELAFEISGYALHASDEERLKYHLAAVFANNFTNHLMALSEKMLTDFNLDFENLKPILLQTAQAALMNSPAENQTGPAIRRDENTIARHLELLNGDEHLTAIYRMMTESIQKFHSA